MTLQVTILKYLLDKRLLVSSQSLLSLPVSHAPLARQWPRSFCFRSPSTNYFHVFQLEERFDLDADELSQKFRRLQTTNHPDKFGNRSESEQATATERSSDINRAYTVLKNPLKRSVHLLEISGHPITEDTSDVGAEFLAEVLDINEQLADVTSREQLERVKQRNTTVLNSLYRSLEDCFNREDFAEARRIVIRIKYYSSVDARVRNYEREHNIP